MTCQNAFNTQFDLICILLFISDGRCIPYNIEIPIKLILYTSYYMNLIGVKVFSKIRTLKLSNKE